MRLTILLNVGNLARRNGSGFLTQDSNINLPYDNSSFKPKLGQEYEFCVLAGNMAGESSLSGIVMGCIPESTQSGLEFVKGLYQTQYLINETSAFELQFNIKEDGVIDVQLEWPDGVIITDKTSVIKTSDGGIYVPIYVEVGSDKDEFISMDIRISSTGKMSICDGACWTDGNSYKSISLASDVLKIITSQLPNGMEMTNYLAQVECAGGTEPYSWSLTGDDYLPKGLSLSEDGIICGVPEQAGHYDFKVKVQDADDEICIKMLSIDIADESDPIPYIGESPSSEDVYKALEGSTDSKLQDNITDGATYNSYRAWATTVRKSDGSAVAGTQVVREAPYAWVSFATDSAALLTKMPTNDDLEIEEFKPSSAFGAFDFTISVRDVTIGDKAIEDNLKKLFGLEGTELLLPAAFSTDNITLEFKKPQDGKLKITATPAIDNAKSFFMKAKVK